jgi:uncharacterized protein YndB with AHSA1/START domain
MLEIRVEATIAAEPARVWEVLADHEGMDKWANLKRVVRIRPGLRELNGVGAVRRLEATGIVMEERITHFEPGRRLDYDVIKGAPGHNAHGQITLTPLADGGTLVWWKVSLHPYIAASTWLVRAFLKSSLTGALKGLKLRLEPDPLFSTETLRAPTQGAQPTTKTRRPSPPQIRASAQNAQRL